MPSTYTPIATNTLTGVTSTVTFSSIPLTFTDLVLVVNAKAGTNASANINFNSDAGNNYSYTVLDGEGSAIQANRQTNTAGIQLMSWSIGMGSTTNSSTATAHIMNYASATTFKTAIVRSMVVNASNAIGVDVFLGTWRNVSPITTLKVASTNFTVGSTFTLYGIKAA